MTKAIAVDWIKNLRTKEEKEEFEAILRGSIIIDRLLQLTLEKENSLERKELSEEDYDSASWAYKQADRNGYRRCLKQFKDLLNFKE